MQFRGISKIIEKRLARLNILSAHDLLFHLPSRYQNRTTLSPIRQTLAGKEVFIEGVIQTVERPKGGRTKLLCCLNDQTGKMHLRFFYVPVFFKKILTPGNRLCCFGKINFGVTGLEMIHPEFQIIARGQTVPLETHLTPIYPTTKGLSQKTLRKLVQQALRSCHPERSEGSRNAQEILRFAQDDSTAQNDTAEALPELIPVDWLKAHHLPSLKEALQWLHQPPRTANLAELAENKTPAQQRLIIEELLAHRVGLLHLKKMFKTQKSLALSAFQPEPLLQQLPFSLTEAQKRVCQEISRDLAQQNPMLRLLQGDVGSGKTVVAAFAMLQTVQNGHQAALMAPTELLAEQHYRTFKQWLEPLGITVALLSSSTPAKAKRVILQEIAEHKVQLILGTHALFQKDVQFAKLALIVIDEQHRFGVNQRALLKEKALTQVYHPHQLIMTATPIPRTLAMSFYSDLDVSLLNEMPAHKATITTSVMANTHREEIIQRIKEACRNGGQAYWVCPLIEESEEIDATAANTLMENLRDALAPLTVALLHGQMPTAEKETAMQGFQAGNVQCLVATTVIEVGIDVQNANLMIIENAERLGLAQLHQLRGRVGRGTVASHCVLLYQAPLSVIAQSRLQIMRETRDGFQIAEHDLKLRGEGELLGTRQTGEATLQIADLVRDCDKLDEVTLLAKNIMAHHPTLIEPLLERWIGKKTVDL